jgi:hypothetical protein
MKGVDAIQALKSAHGAQAAGRSCLAGGKPPAATRARSREIEGSNEREREREKEREREREREMYRLT